MNTSKGLGRSRLLVALAAGVVGLGLASASAHAATACPSAPTTQAFAHWGDTNDYALAPDGDFARGGAGWTLTGGARVLSLQLPLGLPGAQGIGALYLPPGSSAQSPSMCVDSSDPTYRLIAVSAGGRTGGVSTQAVYRTLIGLTVPVTASALSPGSTWGPTPSLLTGSAPASVFSGGRAQMSLRFSAGQSATLLSDVFVDPRMRH